MQRRHSQRAPVVLTCGTPCQQVTSKGRSPVQSTDWAHDSMWHAQVRGTQDVELEFSDIKLAGQVYYRLLA